MSKTKILLVCVAAFFAPAIIISVIVAIATSGTPAQHDALVIPTPHEKKILAQRAEAERRQAAEAHLAELARDADARRAEYEAGVWAQRGRDVDRGLADAAATDAYIKSQGEMLEIAKQNLAVQRRALQLQR